MKKRIVFTALILIFWSLIRIILVKKDAQLRQPRRFEFKPPEYAEKVYVSGNFNNWATEEPGYELLDPDRDGVYTLILPLPPAAYEYKYFVTIKSKYADESNRWFIDVNAKEFESDGYGGRNSVLRLTGDEDVEIIFTNPPSWAKNVYVTGDFDNWSMTDAVYKYKLEKSGKVWKGTIKLKPGRYAYKFVVNPEDIIKREVWLLDPSVPTLTDEHGEINSNIRIYTLKIIIFYYDLLMFSLLLIVVFSGFFTIITEKVMALKLGLAKKFAVIMILLIFVVSGLLFYVEIKERNTLLESQFRRCTNVIDAWFTAGLAAQKIDMQKIGDAEKNKVDGLLLVMLQDMVYGHKGADVESRFFTDITGIAVYDSKGRLIAYRFAKVLEYMMKGEPPIVQEIKKLKPAGMNKFATKKILPTDVAGILPVVKDNKLQYTVVIIYDWIRFSKERKLFLANKLMALFVVVVIGLGIAFMLSRVLTEPIRILTDAMSKVRQGDYAQQVNVYTRDELEDLAQTFNFMTKEIKRYRDMQIDKIIEEQTKTEAIIFSIQDGIILTDFKGNVILCNEQVKKHLGITHILSEGKNIKSILPYPEVIAAIDEVMSHPQERIFKEIEVKFPTYSKFFRSESLSVKTTKDEYIGIAVVVHDITLERELNEMKTTFFNTITHDLKTPITSIVGYLDLLRMGKFASLTEEQNRVLKIMKASTQRLRDLVNNILDVAKIEAGKSLTVEKKRFDLQNMLSQIAEFFKPELDSLQIKLTINISDKIREINADEKQIERVISNLISNALKFTPSGGTITIKAEVGSGKWEVESGTTPYSLLPTPRIIISISDTGSGIPKELLLKVFDKFHQVKGTEKKGTGLGLTICKYIIEAHGGRIWAESPVTSDEINKGTKFLFEIPA